MNVPDTVSVVWANPLLRQAIRYVSEAIILPAFAYLGIFSLLFWPVLLVSPFIATWLVVVRMGQPGWTSLIPIYNWIVLLRIAGLPAWWLILLAIPPVNVLFWFVCCMRFARACGRDRAFGWGLALVPPVYMTILGLSKMEGDISPDALRGIDPAPGAVPTI